MCWTPAHTRQKTKTDKYKKTTQYVVDDTIQEKKRRRQTKQKTQHNM
jgi:hypothetical protein